MAWGYGRETYHNESAYERESGKRARTRFNNHMVAHVWAQRSQTFGQSNNGNFYFEGDSLFSYGSHFLVGFLLEHDGQTVALLTSESYGVSTSGHQSDARGATRHMRQMHIAKLTELRDLLPIMARHSPAEIKRDWPNIPKRVRAWLASPEVTSSDAEGLAIIAKRAGLKESAINAGKREGARKEEARKAANAKREKEALERDAKALASMADSDFAALFPRDGTRTWIPGDSKDYHLQEAERFKSRLFQAQKAARARGWNQIVAKLGERRKIYAAHLSGRNDRIRQAYRDGLAAEVWRWRKGEGSRPNAWRFDSFPAIKRAIERAEQIEERERNLAQFQAWQSGEGKRPSPSLFPDGSHEWLAINRDIADERERMESGFLAWEKDATQWRPPSSYFVGSHYRDSGRFTCRDGVARFTFESGWTPLDRADYAAAFPFHHAHGLLKASEDKEAQERAERERAEREAARLAEIARKREEEAANRERWLAGEHVRFTGSDESGGALMRIVGDTLQTSWGAEVPLEHAKAAFRMIAACRKAGKSWRRNGQTIRVGHFQIDAIEPSGDFKAGCHDFKWPEVSRIARLAGVFEEESE